MSPDLFSGWGIRTLASTEAKYNPMAYHNGSVWPHDNSLIAYGAARYGMPELADRVLDGMFSAGAHFELNRMPELFCGFDREPGVGPIPYPVAWSIVGSASTGPNCRRPCPNCGSRTSRSPARPWTCSSSDTWAMSESTCFIGWERFPSWWRNEVWG